MLSVFTLLEASCHAVKKVGLNNQMIRNHMETDMENIRALAKLPAECSCMTDFTLHRVGTNELPSGAQSDHRVIGIKKSVLSH